MASKNKQIKIKNSYYLFAPFALVAFFLLDFICGINFPAYSWIKNPVDDLCALNAYPFVMSLIFAIIYAILAVLSAYCIIKFFKNSKYNKTLKSGIKWFMIATIIFALTFVVCLLPEYGVYNKIYDSESIAFTTQDIQDEEGNIAGSEEVLDMEQTMNNINSIFDQYGNPFTICRLVFSLISLILFIFALIKSFIGGFKKKGNLLLGGLALFCLIICLYMISSLFVYDSSVLGFGLRFMNYSTLLFLAVVGSYIYITNVKE